MQLELFDIFNDLSDLVELSEVHKASVYVIGITILDECKIGKVHAEVRDARRCRNTKYCSKLLVAALVRHQLLEITECSLVLLVHLLPSIFQSPDGRGVDPRNDFHQPVEVVELPQLFR